MAAWDYPVVDCDGHLIDSIPELTEFLDPGLRDEVLNPRRNREGVFPSLDGFHGPRLATTGREGSGRPYVTASSHRKGSAEDYLAFIEKAGLEQAVMFTSEGLSVGFIQSSEYAVQICRAYNDYVTERYQRVGDRLRPMALIPFQDPEAAAQELRRAVRDLGLVGAMVPSAGLPVHLGHQAYWPIYAAADELDCVLGLHGGSAKGVATAMDSFSVFAAVSGMHHSIALQVGLAALLGHSVFERYRNLRVGFFEGGCGWLVALADRVQRAEEVTGRTHMAQLYPLLENGRILIGCEGNDGSLPHLIQRVGPAPFAWASDYPHEVDLEAARHMIQETVEHPELSPADKAAVLGENARRFFKLETVHHRGPEDTENRKQLSASSTSPR